MNPYIVDPMLKYVAFDIPALARLDPSLCLFLILFFENSRVVLLGYLPVPVLGLDVVGEGLGLLGGRVVAVAVVVCEVVYRQNMINCKTEGVGTYEREGPPQVRHSSA